MGYWAIAKYYFSPRTEMFWKHGDCIQFYTEYVGSSAEDFYDREAEELENRNGSIYGLLVIDGNKINKRFEWEFVIKRLHNVAFGIDESCAKWANGTFCNCPTN